MQEEKFRKSLESATNVAVLMAVVAFLSALSWGYFTHRRTPSLRRGLQKGESIARLPAVDYGSSEQTLLIAMNTECQFCTQSISFYNQLLINSKREDLTQLVALFPNEERIARHYAEQNGLHVRTVAAVDFDDLNVARTPTLLLVDRSGKVLDFWIGKLSEEAQQQVIKAVNSG